MICVENYCSGYYDNCVGLIQLFHKQFLKEFDPEIHRDLVDAWIQKFSGENARNSFLLVIDGECVGIIAGIELKAPLNTKRVFQEVFWFVREPFGRYAIWFINKVRKMLKAEGYEMLMMAVLESAKARRLESIYTSLGFKKLETHYLGDL